MNLALAQGGLADFDILHLVALSDFGDDVLFRNLHATIYNNNPTMSNGKSKTIG
jgi:hypothetical protein